MKKIFTMQKAPIQDKSHVVYELLDENKKTICYGATKTELIEKSHINKRVYFFKLGTRANKTLVETPAQYQTLNKLLKEFNASYFELMATLRKSLKKVNHYELVLSNGIILIFAYAYNMNIESRITEIKDAYSEPIILSDSFVISFHKSLLKSIAEHFKAFKDYTQCFSTREDYFRLSVQKINFVSFSV